MRLGLHGEYGSASNFLIEKDSNQRMGGTLAFGITPIKILEVFGSIAAAANRNQRGEARRADPEIIRSQGDVTLGAKVASSIADGFSAGGELGLRFMSGNDGIAWNGSATSVWFGGLATMDFRDTSKLPLRAHLNLGYMVDNSGEIQNYATVRATSATVSRFAYGIGKSRLRAAVGVDAPLQLEGVPVSFHPFAEYHLEYVTADPDTDPDGILRSYTAAGNCGLASTRPCQDNRDMHWLTIGLRSQLAMGFSIDMGIDVALRPNGLVYGYAMPLMPINFVFGLAHPFDLFAQQKPKIITKTVTVERVVDRTPPPRDGFVAGRVTSAKGEPIVGAIVGVPGQKGVRVATDGDGTFLTKGLPQGAVDLEVLAVGFQPGVIKANVVIGQTTEGSVALTPREVKSRVLGRVVDSAGKAVPASVSFDGPEKTEVKTGLDGTFTATLTTGQYAARASAPGFDAKEVPVQVIEGADRSVEFALGGGAPAPGTPAGKKGAKGAAVAEAPAGPPAGLVTLAGKRLVFKRVVAFKAAGANPSADLLPASKGVLDQLAALLAGKPELKVKVLAHVDASVPDGDALTKAQADSVVAYLTGKGVAADRLEAVGMGAKKPLVPSIIPASKVKNRRLEFQVQ